MCGISEDKTRIDHSNNLEGVDYCSHKEIVAQTPQLNEG